MSGCGGKTGVGSSRLVNESEGGMNKNVFRLPLIIAMFFVCGVWGVTVLVAGENIFSDKAAELCAGKDERSAKIIAVYEFVRDEIKQTKTTYG